MIVYTFLDTICGQSGGIGDAKDMGGSPYRSRNTGPANRHAQRWPRVLFEGHNQRVAALIAEAAG